MSRRKNKKQALTCIEYLSVPDALEDADFYENRQRKHIREYAHAHGYEIVGTLRRHGFGAKDVRRQWRYIAEQIRKGRVQAVIVSSMETVAQSMPDAYYKLGEIMHAGGLLITVDQGVLNFMIGGFNDGRN